MLQTIQFIGTGPPTYVNSKNAVGASGAFYHVFATETRAYEERHEKEEQRYKIPKRKGEGETVEQKEFVVLDYTKKDNLQEIYQKEYGKRELFLWRQR